MNTLSLRRAFFSLPIIGRIAREVIDGAEENFWYLLAALLCLWVISGLIWGLPGIVVPAVIGAVSMVVLLLVMVWG